MHYIYIRFVPNWWLYTGYCFTQSCTIKLNIHECASMCTSTVGVLINFTQPSHCMGGNRHNHDFQRSVAKHSIVRSCYEDRNAILDYIF